MESLKKIISLSQASQISGYTQDYLGYLIRQGEIKGVKKGRVWFTTEEEVKDYIFKKKIRSQKFAISGFFSPSRTKKIILVTLISFLVIFFFLNLKKGKMVPVEVIESGVVSDGEGVKIDN